MDFYVDDIILARRGEEAARALRCRGRCSGVKAAASEERAWARIKKYEREISKHAASAALPAAQWLMDNLYVAAGECRRSAAALKAAKKLPKDETGLPAIIDLAEAYMQAAECVFGEKGAEAFLAGAQRSRTLTERELSLFIPAVTARLIAALEKAAAAAAKDAKRAAAETLSQEEKYGAERLMKNIFTSLRFISGFDASDMLENASAAEKILRMDPSGEYALMDEDTRAFYRRRVEKEAEKQGKSEAEYARELLRRAEKSGSHIGFELLAPGRRGLKAALYIPAVAISALLITALFAALAKSAAALLLFFPAWSAAKAAADFFAARLNPPDFIPRMELAGGIPPQGRTLCAVSALITSPESGREAAEKLETYMLTNRDAGRELVFAVLADLKEAKNESLAEDEENLAGARREIERLNEEYGGGFFLLARKRRFNEKDGVYMGWERKRGAVLELARFLRGRSSGTQVFAGDAKSLENVKYMIILDGDTRLCAGTAKNLAGAMLHPLNKAAVENGKVVSGRGILQPRITPELEAAGESYLAMLFAGQGGADPYGCLAGEVYQDLFSQGSFSGKGIADVDAYLACLDGRFPENTILSHDLLEGEYLNAAYISDIELLDGFPSKTGGYYSRMHRWTRGDWQTLPWLFPRVRREDGRREKNALNAVSRFKIFDNLAQSLAPAAAAALIAAAAFSAACMPLAAAAALCFSANFIIISAEAALRRAPRERHYSALCTGFAGELTRLLSRFILLGHTAFVRLSAVLTALYRMLVSGRGMLEWVTAAEADKNAAKGLAGIYRSMAAQTVLGFIMLVFSRFPLGSALGAVWLAAPLFAWDLSRERARGEEKIPEGDRAFLMESAADIWSYFRTYLTAEDNYLPPDNRQEQPAPSVAHRTSPTNIGLAMLSAISACELGVCSKHEAAGVIENIICTLERIPKWHGHISNWYDTRTLKPLGQEYVSTVDSGNLAGALAAAKAALKKYAPEDESLAARAEKLYGDMDFSYLYDKKKRLFYIGVSLPEGKPAEGWYDLMASEARLASYIAIAKGEAERRHWRRLGRTLTGFRGRRGLISWTGTMFEYLMPELLMPAYRDSLMWESLKFCVYVQKNAAKRGKPWGESESAFFAFDSALNYRYKAHGVQLLALKRGMDKDAVFAPYASFLALEYGVSAAVKNLKSFDKAGMRGRFGYYDALDATEGRAGSAAGEPVRTYMAHHLGMSITAICNALCSGAVRNYFMADAELAAFSELLKERVPAGRVALERGRREVPEKPERAPAAPAFRAAAAGSVARPLCTAFSSGAYSVAAAESGMTRSVWNGLLVTDFEPRENSSRGGMAFYLTAGGKTVPLLPYMALSDTAWSAEISGESCAIKGIHGDIESVAEVFVPQSEAGEVREIRIKNSGTGASAIKLRCAFEPVLARAEEYEAHAAFSKLGLEARRKEGAVIVKRRGKGKAEEDVFLAFACSLPMRCCMSRSVFPGRYGDAAFCAESEIPESENGGADVFITAELSFALAPGEEKLLRFAFSCAYREEDALAAAKRLLSAERAASFSADLQKEEMERARDALFFRPAGGAAPPAGGRGLWRYGISGDLPLFFCRVSGEKDLEKAKKALETHEKLKRRALEYDLVFLTGEPAGYRRPLRTALRELAEKSGAAENARGGVYIPEEDAECAAVLEANACAPKRPALPDARKPLRAAEEEKSFSFSAVEGRFEFFGKNALPPKVWSLPLANESFGYIAADTGLGHMWYANSRENRITPWTNRPFGVCGGERLTFCAGGKRYSLFADTDGAEYKVIFEPGCAIWEKRVNEMSVRTTAFVPPDTAARVLIIEAEGGEINVEWEAALFPQSERLGAAFTEVLEEKGALYARPLAAPGFEGTLFSLRASAGFENLTPRANGRFDAENAKLAFGKTKALVIVCGCAEEEALEALKNPERAFAELEKTKEYWKKRTGVLKIETPEPELDEYINTWALYQLEASRLLARSSVYQCGGAYGFRDQLQDECALAAQRPETLAAFIRLACRHQFIQGDVQHWWHPNLAGEPERGVRTRCSDDLLWLPYSVCEYCRITGDTGILREEERYIASPPLREDERERYEAPERTQTSESVYMHAARAADEFLRRGTGRHGLALIGTGDWNDGFSEVGEEGAGESVWLSMFAAGVLRRFAELCRREGDGEREKTYLSAASALASAAEKAWDGDHFIRAYYDGGKPLGAYECAECRIDAVAQSFADFAGIENEEKIKTALESAVKELFDRENGLIRLFTPPFDSGPERPGYVRGYMPGVRENGGQYTHGAIWLAAACLRNSLVEEGWSMLRAMLPAKRPAEEYAAEPFVLAADTYTAEGALGMGGWSWYTGSAGWYYRTVCRELLGLKVENGLLEVSPRLPQSWQGFRARIKTEAAELEIEVSRAQRESRELDGEPCRGIDVRSLRGRHLLKVGTV